MSTTIDERVVSMQFDNSHFEKNVSTTMSSLDKLKQKLNLEGAAKGFENVDSAAKRVNLSGLSAAADTVAVKFSHMQMTIQHQLDRIVDSAVNAGTRLVKSLSVDQITAGWSKYEKKTASIQTIMNATGKSIDEVNQYLNKLMWFSDETSYGFTDMTSGLATMVSSGGDIEKLIPMLMGVANATAFAGKGAAEFSRVLQFGINQAYSLGYMQVQDWKTIEGATVNSKQLMETLIRAGEELGKIKKDSITTSTFRKSLADQWLDKDVMEKAFGEFAEMSEKAYEMVQSGEVDTASEAYEILSKQYDGVAITAAKAAQEAKTFTEAIDATKDAVSSGWMRTFEIIFGDYDKAKKQWTDLANLLWDMFASGSEGRNDFLAEVFDSPWDKLIDKLSEAKIGTDRFEDSIRSVVGDTKLSKLIEEYGSLEEAVRSGEISSYDLKQALKGVTDTGLSGIVDGLKEIDQVLRRGVKSDDVRKMQTALKELGYDLGEFGESADGIDGSFGPVTKKAIEAFQEAHGLVVDGIAGPETMAALSKASEELASMTGDVDGLSESCDSLLDVITQRSGRELLFDSLMNILKAVQKHVDAVKEAFGNVFSLSPDSLYAGLKKINNFTKKLVDGGILDAETWEDLIKNVGESGVDIIEFSDRLKKTLVSNGVDVDELTKKYGTLGKAFEDGAISADIIKEVLLSFDGITENIVSGSDAIADKLRRTFEGVFALVDAIATILSGPLRLVFNVVTKVLKNFGLTVLDITARAGDSLVAFRNTVDNVVETISTFIAEHVTKWVEKFKETEFFKTVAQWFEDSSEKISDAVDNISQRFANFQATPVIQTLSKIGGFFTGLAEDFAESEFGSGILEGISNTFDGIKTFFSKIPKITFGDFATIFASLEGTDVSSFTGIMGTLGGALKENVFGKVKKFFQNLSGLTWDEFKVTAINKFVTFWTSVGDKIKKAFESCKEIWASVKEFVFGSQDVKLADILNLAERILMLVIAIKALNALSTVMAPFDNITDALNNFASSLKWKAISSTFKSMAIALGALTLCIIALSQIKDMKKARSAAIMLGSLLIIMGGVAVALGFASNKLGSDWSTTGAAISLLAMVGAIVLLIKAIKDVDAMDLRDPFGTFTMITGALLAMMIGMTAISKAGGSSFKSIAAVLTLITALKMLLDVITAYDEYDWTGKSIAIDKMTKMLFTLSAALAVASIGSGASMGMAFTLLAMVVSLKLILNAIKEFANVDDATMEKGGRAVAKLLGIMTVMAVAISVANQGTVLEKGQRSVNSFTGLAVALLAVVGAIYLLGKMATENRDMLVNGGNAVGQILLAFTAMLTAVGYASKGLTTGTVLSMLLMFGVLLAEITIIIKQLESVSWQSSLSTAGALGGLILAMAFALRSLTKYDVWSGNIYMWVGAMALLGVIMAILGGVLYTMKDIPWENALANASALGILLGAMALTLLTLTKYTVSSDKLLPWIGAFAGLTVVLWALSEVLKPMNNLDAATSLANAASLSLLLGVMAGVIFVLSKVKMGTGLVDAIVAIAVLGLVVLELGYFLSIIKTYNISGMENEVLVLSALLVVLTGVMAVCAVMGKVAGTNLDGLMVCALAIGLLGAVVWELGFVLSKLQGLGIGGMIKEVGVLSALLVVLTGVMAACGAMGVVLQKPWVMLGLAVAVGAIAALGLVVWELGAILKKLKGAGIGGMLPEVGVLSALLVVLTGVMAACAVIGLLGGSAFRAVIVLAALGLVIWELGAILNAMREYNLGNAMPMVETLSALLNVLVDALGKLAVIGILSIPALGAVGVLGVLAAELFLFMAGLAAIKDTATAKANVETICTLLTNLTQLTLLLSLVGPGAILGVTAIGGLIFLVEKLALFAAAIGTLKEWFGKEDSSVIESGMDVLVMIAGKIGEMIGAIGAGITSKLAEMGKDLLDFANGLGPFLAMLYSVTPYASVGAYHLTSAILKLLSADILAGIASWFNVSLADLGTELSTFASNLGGFIDAMKDVDPNCATGAEALAKAIGVFTATAFLDGLGDWIFGSDNLSQFSQNIAEFATCIKDASVSVKDITDEDVANIQRSADAGTALADLNQAIPRQGGWLQDFIGSKDLAAFGEAAVAFAKCIIDYSAVITGNPIDATAIEESATAGKALADVAAAIPSSGGKWQEWTGEKSLATFGQTLVEFGTCLVDYNAKVTGQDFDADAISNSAVAAGKLAEVADALPAADGKWQKWAGEKDLGTFGDQLAKFADGLLAYCAVAIQIDDTKIAAINKSGEAIDAINTVLEKIEPSGGVGDWLFGSSDGLAFGEALTSLATGLSDYCNSVAGIDFDKAIANVQSSKSVVEEMGKVLDVAPDKKTSKKATHLYTAATNIQNVASVLNAISSAGYDYSGITSLKSNMSQFISIVSRIDGEEVSSRFYNLSLAVGSAKTCAERLEKLNDKTYPGIGRFRSALSFFASSDYTFDGVDIQTGLTNVSNAVTTAVGISDNLFALNDRTYSGISVFKEALTTLSGAGADIDFTAVSENIKSAETAIAEMYALLENAPSNKDVNKAQRLLDVATDIQSVADALNAAGSPENTYSGLIRLKTNISQCISIVANIDTDTIKSRFDNLLEAINAAKDCADTLVTLNDKTYNGVNTFKSALTNLSSANVDDVITAFSGKNESMSSAIESLTTSMSSGFDKASDKVTTSMSSVIGGALDKIGEYYDDFVKAGKTLVDKLIDGLETKAKLSQLYVAADALGIKAVSAVESSYTDMQDAGKYLGAGLVNGIQQKMNAVYWAGYNLGKEAVRGEKDGQNSASPSKETIKAGKWLGEGLIIGIGKMTSSVYNAGHDLGSNATNSIRSAISRISDSIDTNIDTQPTIRPILDLSEVRTGAGAINGMLGGTRSLNMTANVGSIASMMNERSQNGTNDDVVKAINGLRDRLDNVGNTSYNINGVTYDDGSNIANAVREITRVAVRERRV